MGVSDSWTNESIVDEEIALEGYELFRRDRAAEGKGGDVRCTLGYCFEGQKSGMEEFPEQFWRKIKSDNRELCVGVCRTSMNQCSTVVRSMGSIAISDLFSATCMGLRNP